MRTSTDALAAFLTANPEAARSARRDAEFAAEVVRMRTVLDALDSGLEAEGLGVEARQRIAVRLAADCLLTDEARAARMEERHRLAQEFAGGALPAL
ncbi:hypothetical protein ACIQGT_13935 [Streptomyces sp. NPDC093108]|uniref:hypothetical protein n=1 Tax=Streptomyces sp. NPDC093108 TaxID=3366030 RepID=UPI00382804A3